MSSHYAGISAFKGYMQRMFGYSGHPYDWADLNSSERSEYARREATRRERRQAAREAKRDA